MNYRLIFNAISLLILILAVFMLSSLLPAYLFRDEHIVSVFFLTYPLIVLLVSAVLFFKTRADEEKKVSLKESFTIVTLGWLSITFVASYPYVFLAKLPFVDAFFETMSGLTTTGASILVDIESYSHALLYWRSLTNWLGGMGIIVLFLAILPFLGLGVNQIYKAEVPGMDSEKLTSRIAGTAKILWLVYCLLTFALFCCLKILGLSSFDALCHAFTTVATGGFSTKNESIAAFSPHVQNVIAFFMLLAGCNFILHIKALRGKLSNYFANEEFLYYLGISFFSIFLLAGFLSVGGVNIDFFESLRLSFFQVFSILTTTGFSTTDFSLWPSLALMVIFILFFLGACGGSTSGGIKISRVILCLKHAFLQIKKNIKPHHINAVSLDKKAIQEEKVTNIYAFCFLFFAIFLFVSFLMVLLNPQMDLMTAFSASIASLSNIGPGLGGVGPLENYSWISEGSKWILSFTMLIGRLELYTVLLLLTPSLWVGR